jgi:hypothetical protein
MAAPRFDVRCQAVGIVFAVALGAATAPAWRVVLLGAEPTLEQLLALRCSSRDAAAAGGPAPPALESASRRDIAGSAP